MHLYIIYRHCDDTYTYGGHATIYKPSSVQHAHDSASTRYLRRHIISYHIISSQRLPRKAHDPARRPPHCLGGDPHQQLAFPGQLGPHQPREGGEVAALTHAHVPVQLQVTCQWMNG
jgi:hypothetical protein